MFKEYYPATVTTNIDDENRGRIKVACVGLLGDEETELPMWVEPLHDWGWFYVPDVGEIVEIEVITNTVQDEQFGQSSIDNLDIHWRSKRYYTDNEEGDVPTAIHPDFINENYGKRRGFSTPAGQIFLFDDTDGATKIYLTWVKKAVEPGQTATDDNMTQLLIDTDGSFSIKILNKQSLILKAEDNELEISLEESKHTLIMKPGEFEIKLAEGASLKLTGKDAEATTILGDGSVSATIADHLETLYGELAQWLEQHKHPTGMGPSGPPDNIPAPTWNAAINSTKLTFPDG